MAEFIINLGQAFKEIFSRCIDFPKSVWIYLVFFQGNVRKFICWYSLYSNIIQFWSKLLIFRVQLIWKVWKGISCCLIKIRQLPDRSGTCQIKIRRQPDWSGCCLIKIRQLPDRTGPRFVRSLPKRLYLPRQREVLSIKSTLGASKHRVSVNNIFRQRDSLC